MNQIAGFLLLLTTLAGSPPSEPEGNSDLIWRTLRIDYLHAGTAAEEHFALRRIRIEGAWSGSRTQLLDTTNLGKYRIEVVDQASQQLLYSRGFASIYGEWETTGEARGGTWQGFEEAVRIPEPRRPFQLRMRKRDASMNFREVWTLEVDPNSRFVNRPPSLDDKTASANVREVMIHGDPADHVDLLILGDGYEAAAASRFDADVRRATAALFSIEPFKSRREDFNVRSIFSPASHHGISRPRAGVFRDTPLGTRYNSFDSERYVLSLEDRRWRDVASAAPYDFILILAPERKYGGGGIFGLYSTAASGSSYFDYLVVHEFGHHFAGLADEYYTSDVAYDEFVPVTVEPWEPNVTALLDPDRLKWAQWVGPATPLPTPWPKAKYEEASHASQQRRRELRAQGAAEDQLESLFDEERELFTSMLAEHEFAGEVGAFEGALYESQGFYRPAADCIMFTRDEVGFCPVCRHAISRIIDLYAH